MTSDSFIQLRRNEFRAFRTMFRPALRCAATALWAELLVRANWEDGYFDGQQLKRGQVVFGRKELGECTGISIHTVRTILRKLEQMEKLTIKSTSHGTIASIIEYDAYVGGVSQDNQQPASNPPAINQQSTSNQPTINQQSTNNPPATRHSEETNKLINKEVIPFEVQYLQKRGNL